MKLSRICKVNYAISALKRPYQKGRIYCYNSHYIGVNRGIFDLTTVPVVRLYGIIYITYMTSDPQAKQKALQATGTLNPRAAQVRHPLFQKSGFFDPEDLLQLKYETLRAMEVESCPMAKAAREFGLSRPTIYEAQSQFQQQGLAGLLPHKRGPKAAHKLTAEIRQYLQAQLAAEPGVKAEELARRALQRYAVKLHSRTIQKALRVKVKRGRLI